MIDKFFLLVFVTLLGYGCDYRPVKDESSEFYVIPVGSALVLNVEVVIPPDQVSVLIQNGMVQHHANVDFYKPNCKFELYSISENARLVKPDYFLIKKVVDENEYSGLRESYYASRTMLVTDEPETITYATVMYLHSDIQPDVYRMTCKHWESVVDDRFLSVSAMRKAMGDIVSLRINY